MTTETTRSAPITPRLRWMLRLLYLLVGALTATAAYLGGVSAAESITGDTYQGYVYQWAVLAHLGVGLLVVLPFLIFAPAHALAARSHPNRRAARMGYGLAALAAVVLVSGLALLRVAGFELRQPGARAVVYWAHVLVPFGVAWAFVNHRRRGRAVAPGAAWTWVAATAALVALTAAIDVRTSRPAAAVEPVSFAPSFARTASGRAIPAAALMIDDYCAECHADAHRGWLSSAHRFSSFNNPVYKASVKETREVMLARDGDVDGSRWCAGCHDPVPLFSGAFDRPDFDTENDPTGQAGLTCTACHAIEAVNSTRGNGDYTIGEPRHYPLAFSSSPTLRAVSRQLVRAKPAFHKATFLKPVHRSAEFCSTCHKVHIPGALNDYREFLRGQNHYDSYLLSGVSGHGVRAFYYPPKAETRCAGCHMPPQPSADFGAQPFDGTGALQIHDHRFLAANTGVAHLRGDAATVAAQQAFLDKVVTLDVFAVREGGTVSGRLIGPLGPGAPALAPGRYLVEIVLRTRKVGHHFTQGTADSNQVWVALTARAGDRLLGTSGALEPDGRVDPWAHFTNVYMLDRQARKVDRRNVQDIYVPLYDKQIPPGAAQVVHYALEIPADALGPVTIEARLQYRKFDVTMMALAMGETYRIDLPVTTIAAGAQTLPAPADMPAGAQPAWERWNDYGIGLLLEGNAGSEKGELRQAEAAFAEVERLGRPEGPLNLARVYYKEGRLDDAAAALNRARAAGAAPWTVAWLTGLVNKENGHLDEAIANLEAALAATSPELRARGFDFSKDYEVLNELGQVLFERAKQERGTTRAAARAALLHRAVEVFDRTLTLDAENVTAHYALSLLFGELGDATRAAAHREAHQRYTPDEQSRSRVLAQHRLANPAANHAAQALVVYDLQRRAAQSSQAPAPRPTPHPTTP